MTLKWPQFQFILIETVATCDPRLGEDVSKFGSVFKDWLKLKSTSNLTSRLEPQVQYQNMPRLYSTLVDRLRKLTAQCYLYRLGHLVRHPYTLGWNKVK